MKAFEAIGESIHSINKNPKIWRYPVIASGAAAILLALCGVGDDAKAVGYSPNTNTALLLAVILIALFLKLTTIYYPTRAFYYHKKGIPFDELGLVKESVLGGILAILVAIVYGIIIGIIAIVLLAPAIISYYLLQGSAKYLVSAALALPPGLFIFGILVMLIPAYIWTKSFDRGFEVFGMTFSNKKETLILGALILLVTLGFFAAAEGVIFVSSGILRGAAGALVVGLFDGIITGLTNVVSNTTGAAMYEKLQERVEIKERPANLDPDWLASL